ncbi:MAG: hypothetical protein KF680_10405 [Cryobacterium sp.]|nr:hypothetical protein [Cryobacterium sp.]
MTTATLTERYLHAATRGLPETQRAEIRQELAERIGDDIDARVRAGADPTEAETLALTELGDPDVLVAQYLDRPQFLIGPQLFPTWKRLLRVLALTVIPTVAVFFTLAQTLAHKPFGEIVGSTVVVLIMLTVHLGFWTTLVFAVLERSLDGKPIMEWTPELLPEITDSSRNTVRIDVASNLVFIALFATGLFAHTLVLPFRDSAGETVPLVQPDTWAWLPWYLTAVLVLDATFWMLLARRGHWNYWFVALRTVLSLANAIPVAWLFATDRLFNHEFLALTGWNNWQELVSSGGVLAIVFAFFTVGISAIWPIDAFLKARHAGRGGR